jgi:hypothetical protein
VTGGEAVMLDRRVGAGWVVFRDGRLSSLGVQSPQKCPR